MSSGQSTTVDIDPSGAPSSAATGSRLRIDIEDLRETGRMFYDRGWSLGTSSNYSVVLDRDPLVLLVTASGKDKGCLKRTDFVRVDARGERIERSENEFPKFPHQNRPSAETQLHVAIAEQPNVGAVLHTHSVWSTLLSERYFGGGGLEVSDYEMLKGLEGITTHETIKRVPIFDNTQDIPALASQLREKLGDRDDPLQHGFLIRKHELYTWGPDLATARRHVEIFEFLFECVGRLEFAR